MAQNKKRRDLFFSGPGGGPSLTSGGGGIFIAFLAIVIGGSFLLTGGNPLPQRQLTDHPDGVYEIDEESLTPDGGRANLQLRTIKFKECASQAAVGLLVDRSGSMAGSKLQNLKAALNSFSSTLGEESIVGMSSFSSNDCGSTGCSTAVREDVPFGKYADVAGQFSQATQGLQAIGATNTRTGFAFMMDKILAAQQEFPDQTFNLILITDGIPEAGNNIPETCAPTCDPQRCFETTQDPTVNPDLAQELKTAGVRIFSIALYDASDACFQNDLRAMMQRVASPDSYFETPNSSELEGIYSEISTRICQSVQ